MNIQEIINGRLGVGLAYGLSQVIPESISVRLTHWVGSFLARRKNLAMVKAVRANRWVASDCQLFGIELDRAVAESFAYNAFSLYYFFRNFQNPAAMRKLARFPDVLRTYLHDCIEQKKGLIITGVHLGNFDLVMQAIGQQTLEYDGLKIIALGVPNPGKGYEWQNEFRRKNGINVMPASLVSIKSAAEILKQGGVVISGLDRPVPDAKYRPVFFGRPAALPVIHVPLALMSKSPVLVAGSIMQPDGTFKILLSDPIYLKKYPDRMTEILSNAEAVLAYASDYISQAPAQWTMPHAVWPDVLNEIPV